MASLVLYIAASLDGFIARPDGRLDWLDALPNPGGSDHGYGDLLARIDTILMGRSTYEAVLGFGIEWPYAGFQTFVITHNPEFRVSTPDTAVLSGDIAMWVDNRRREGSKDIWLVGGGQLKRYFLQHQLIDEFILTLIPTLLGEGIPLFPAGFPQSEWNLSEVTRNSSGAVGLKYAQQHTAHP